jgi:hypothetical protein
MSVIDRSFMVNDWNGPGNGSIRNGSEPWILKRKFILTIRVPPQEKARSLFLGESAVNVEWFNGNGSI